ncbi:vacuolar ATPase assembly integral membrane protein vma21 [Basidiobolus ranarum]|uniref:Vacuolar ATPase assembly integral membrane protein vma21 n=1 Tax=Basidiobolus ranarum TaxID=34480 RepID=A0ABR2X2P9_9FUNG
MTSLQPQENIKGKDVPNGLFKKLLYMTGTLILAPITVFFILQYFTDNNLVSAGSAAVLANIIVFGYVATIMNSETEEEKQKKSE